MKATISADIISFTALSAEDRLMLQERILHLFEILENTFGKDLFYGRLIKGDYIECVLDNPSLALKVALLIKSYIKSTEIKTDIADKRIEEFKEHGIRIAVAVANLTAWDREKGVMDGEAIYLSGRAVNEMTATSKKIKSTLVFKSSDKMWNAVINPMFNLLDVLFSKYKRAQSEVIFYKLLHLSEKEICDKLKKSQSTINQHSTSTGWWAVESAVESFEKIIR